jgi:acyl-CoA thioester hydrolase
MTIDAPYTGYRDRVRPEWTDYSGHMNVAYYGYVFEEAARAFFRDLDISQAYRERSNHAFFALEQHMIFKRELLEGQPLRFEAQILAFNGKRIDVFYRMLNDAENYLAATQEVLYGHVDLAARRSVPVPPEVAARLASVVQRHLALPRPPEAGRAILPDRGKAG